MSTMYVTVGGIWGNKEVKKEKNRQKQNIRDLVVIVLLDQ